LSCGAYDYIIPMVAPDKKRRQARRQPVRRAAWVSLGKDQPAVACVLWDISQAGARLRAALRSADLAPGSFLSLTIGKEQRNCRVAWSRNGFVGVEFV